MATLREWPRSLEEASKQELWRGELSCELDALQIIEALVTRVESKLDKLV